MVVEIDHQKPLMYSDGNGRLVVEIDHQRRRFEVACGYPSCMVCFLLRNTLKAGSGVRSWLFVGAVENEDMNVALLIAKKYPELGSNYVLGILAQKPDAFSDTKSEIFGRTISSIFAFIGLKVGAPEKESKALQLLRIVLEDILKRPKKVVDNILRGPPDSNYQSSSESVRTLMLKNLISQLLNKMDVETHKILIGHTELASSGKVDQALQLKNIISEHLLNMYVEAQKIIKQDHMDVVVSGNGHQAQGQQNFIHGVIARIQEDTENFMKQEHGKEDQALHLHEIFSKHITLIHAGKLQRTTFSSAALFLAAEKGNTKFVIELIRRYPELSRKVNENNETIFHIAIKHRHQDIYNLLYQIGAMKELIFALKDSYNNNLLHLAGMRATRLEDVNGVLLQMQQELLWFKEVESIMPPFLREQKNRHGLTPRELFTKEHKVLITQGEKWMKETASECMVVSTLIATIVFASAFTVPGGYDQNTGIPILYSKTSFIICVMADAISLFTSSASILIFLSILTSRYAQRDFLESLPKKLIFGLSTLFLSITTMMIAFSVNFFLLYDKDFKWKPILVSTVLAAVPVVLYVASQYKLFTDVIRSTYGFRSLFKLRRDVLYN